MLNWSKNKICYSRYKLYVPIVTLSIQDNAKLLEELNAISKPQQLTAINIYQKPQQKEKIILRLLNWSWSKSSRSK